jgi:catechol 2,3-dioxygenase-like lactoylglutathione lyase family enzyme
MTAHTVGENPFMTLDPSTTPDFTRAQLVPELLVADIDDSLRFWRDLCGFQVAYDRPDEGFAYLDRNGAQVMLEERDRDRNWITGPLERPLGRGINLQISVASIEPILAAIEGAAWPLFMAPEHKWYRTGSVETGVEQFLVQDPDGYLIRFSARLNKQ